MRNFSKQLISIKGWKILHSRSRIDLITILVGGEGDEANRKGYLQNAIRDH